MADGDHIVTGSHGLARKWSIQTKKLVESYELPMRELISFAMYAKGNTIAYGDINGELTYQDLRPLPTPRAEGHAKAGYNVSWGGKDEGTLATFGLDETVRIWDVKSGRQRKRFVAKNIKKWGITQFCSI